MKAPHKVYTIDTGLANAISVRFSKDIGKAMENTVFLTLRRHMKENKNIFYWKGNQHEVDFLIKRDHRVYQLIQATYASTQDEIERREVRSLARAGEKLKRKNLLIVTWDYEDTLKMKDATVKCIPLWKWLINMDKPQTLT